MERRAVEKDLAAYQRAGEIFQTLLPSLRRSFAGKYFLVHTATLESALGDPAQDDNGGYRHARENFSRVHGDLSGQYFGKRIPVT